MTKSLQFSHVFFTSPDTWEASLLDYEFSPEDELTWSQLQNTRSFYDPHFDAQGVLVYGWLGSDRQPDGLVKMAEKLSDIDRWFDRFHEMVYRWLDVDGWSDGLIAGWMSGVLDRQVA